MVLATSVQRRRITVSRMRRTATSTSLLIVSCIGGRRSARRSYDSRMYLAAPVCPNCQGHLDASGTPEAPHWYCEACELIVLDTPATATPAGTGPS
jgi:hypothetical protein